MLHQANGCRETSTRTGGTIVAGGLEISTAAIAGAGAVAGSSTVGADAGDNAVAVGAVGGSEFDVATVVFDGTAAVGGMGMLSERSVATTRAVKPASSFSSMVIL